MMRAGTLCAALVAAATAAAGDETAAPSVEIVTSVGSMTVELWPDKAPQTVDNFLRLVDDGFYQGTVFHRVIAAFMIQAGGYDADLAYRESPRSVVNESANGLRNVRWTIAMARHSDPDSAGAQFFINMVDNEHLDAAPDRPGYTVFGKLTAGKDVAEEIELTETHVVGDMVAVPVTPITILAVRRVERPSGEQSAATEASQ